MPPSAIAGFVKKRTAAQRYKRSPRQLTRDITLAIELQDQAVLPHLRVRAEDGEIISGEAMTSDLIKRLREEGRNPMWYLRRTWLEETFGRREQGNDTSDESTVEKKEPQSKEKKGPHIGDGLTEMLKESIQELKQDKDDLKAQLTIKDRQINEQSERWKESNVLTRDLHRRIDTMEAQMERLLLGPAHETGSDQVAEVVVDSESQEEGTADHDDTAATTRESESSVKAQSPAKPKNARKPKWYETPTLDRFAARFRSR